MFPWQCRLCPPGMKCKEGVALPCPQRMTSLVGENNCRSAPLCESYHICEPGHFQKECPLGNFLIFESVNGNVGKNKKRNFLEEFDPGYMSENFTQKYSYTCNTCPPGTACPLYAKDKANKCKGEQFNSYFNQSTCSNCDKGFEELCEQNHISGAAIKSDIVAAKCYSGISYTVIICKYESCSL